MHITLTGSSGNKGGCAYHRIEEHPVFCISQHVGKQEMQACVVAQVGKASRKGLTSLLMACILSGRFADWG